MITTTEYDIKDWAIKVKIGGFGIMTQLMGKNLESQNLIWVVPCVGDIDYQVTCCFGLCTPRCWLLLGYFILNF